MNINDNQHQLVKTARTTVIWYLIMAVSGILGVMVLHSQVFVSGNPEQTLTNLIEFESTARTRLLLEIAILISQALTAVWFYKLFKSIDNWAAWIIGIWGTVNAIAIMISAISMASAIGIADITTLNLEDKVTAITILHHFIANAWGVGSLFFGLWLFPMGYIVVQSKRLPVWLGRILLLGGAGYVLSTILNYMGIEFPYRSALTIPATIGEFWMIGYLLIYGIRPEHKAVE